MQVCTPRGSGSGPASLSPAAGLLGVHLSCLPSFHRAERQSLKKLHPVLCKPRLAKTPGAWPCCMITFSWASLGLSCARTSRLAFLVAGGPPGAVCLRAMLISDKSHADFRQTQSSGGMGKQVKDEHEGSQVASGGRSSHLTILAAQKSLVRSDTPPTLHKALGLASSGGQRERLSK